MPNIPMISYIARGSKKECMALERLLFFLLCNGQIQDKYAFALQICLKNVAKYSYDFSMGSSTKPRTPNTNAPVALKFLSLTSIRDEN